MLTEVIALVIYVAAAFAPNSEPRYGAFDTKESCEQAVAQACAAGLFTTDCVRVELGKPRNGVSS